MPIDSKLAQEHENGIYPQLSWTCKPTSKSLALSGSDIREDNVALSLGLAVAAAAVEFTEAVDGETSDLEGATAVVLKNLIFSAESTTAGDGGGLAGLLLLDRKSVLAHCGPPDVSQLAGAHAVDTFDLVGADDDVGERSAGLCGVSYVCTFA